MDITFFNPRSQSEADFIASFVARQNVLEHFINQLRRIADGSSSAAHHLIVAPRGYGKTSLLRRIGIAIRTTESLSSKFLALAFREEQHNVISLDVFWRNCLQSLIEARELESAPSDEIAYLDRAFDTLAPRANLKREEQDGGPAHSVFSEHCEKLGRRPVLLIDNLDALLAGLNASAQWTLRAVLQGDDGPVLISAASRFPEATVAHDTAFFDFFRIQSLDRLTDSEVMRCLRTLASYRGEAGARVLGLLDRDPGRVGALNTLAGGNPRTLSVIYMVLESHISADVLSQLSAMLDTFTGWYQARTEELAPQARAVFDAVALHWDPVTAADLSISTGLDTPSVNSHLSRLEKSGYVEPVALSRSGRGRSGYQVSERFFNIWYLMRNGARRTQRSIRFLAVFLQSCFNTNERRTLALSALRDGMSEANYSLALASTLPPCSLRNRLLNQVEKSTGSLAPVEEIGAILQELRGPTRSDKKVGGERGNLTFKKLMAAAQAHHEAGRYADAAIECKEAIKRSPRNAMCWAFLGHLCYVHLERFEDAENAFRKAIKLDPENPLRWIELGDVCRIHLNRLDESEIAYKEAIKIESNSSRGWAGLGYVFMQVGRVPEAESAFRKATVINPQEFAAWVGLASLLQVDKARTEEAEASYRAAIQIAPENSRLWNAYADFLVRTPERLAEAEIAYGKAIEIEPTSERSLVGLGYLLETKLGRFDEAERQYRLAIVAAPQSGAPWAFLADLLKSGAGRFSEAEEAYREALRIEPRNVWCLIAFGNFLRFDLKRNDEAEVLLRRAIEEAPTNPKILFALGTLLRDMGRVEEAKTLLLQATEYGPGNDECWVALGNLMLDYLADPAEAAKSYQSGLASCPGSQVILRANLAYALSLHAGDAPNAKIHVDWVLNSDEPLSTAGRELLRSLPVVLSSTKAPPAEVLAGIGRALESDDPQLWSSYLDDLQRLLWFMISKGHGEWLRACMEEEQYPQRFAPLYHAVLAALEGEDHLLRVNPETRQPAQLIFDGLGRRLRIYSQSAARQKNEAGRR